MYLKRLTLRGFKSFASATTMVFEPGITCVVGPNGSGKSNVVDALAWVMGEQGAKSLRGGKMEDVIFAGTTKRAPLGRAEVELTIDNTDGALPIEYTEVTITRTMFRSGGSEYQINGSPARLLDVQELLSDSGIGREMHVIVGQGQLDAILQATPESRRGFIEEAAGVLKHRKRKEKALRKLDATQSNLDRLTDLIAELSRQLKPLGRQAKAARKAAVIQAELRDAKARLLAEDMVNAKKALEEDLADERQLAEARARAEKAVEDASAAEANAELELKEAARRYDKAQETWYALAGLRERVGSTVSIAAERSRMADNQPQLDVGGRDPEALEKEAREVREREQHLREQVEAAHQELTDATLRRNGAEKQHAAAEEEYAAALRAVADRREGKARLVGKVNSAKSRLDASQEEIARLERRREDALQRAKEAERQFHSVEASLAGLGADESDLDAAYEAAAEQLERAQNAVDGFKSKEAELQRERASAEAKVEALKLMAQRKDGSAALLEGDDDHILGRLSDFLTVKPGWEVAIAAALGSAAEAVVVDGFDAARATLRRLTDDELGRAPLVMAGTALRDAHDVRSSGTTLRDAHDVRSSGTGQPALSVVQPKPEVAGAVSWLLQDFVIVENADEAEATIADGSLSAVTRAGDVFGAHVVEGGSQSAPSLIEVGAQLAEAEEALAKLSHDIDRLRFEAEKSQAELVEAEMAEADALAQLHASDAQLAAVADQLSAHRQTQAGATSEADRLNDAIEQAKQARVRDEEALVQLEARLEAASEEHEEKEPDPSERDRRVRRKWMPV